MTRLYGRGPRGDRVVEAVLHGRWETSTRLSAIRLEGVIQPASLVFDGPTDATVFLTYVQQCLAPALRPGDVVVMDNLSSHKVKGVVETIQAVGAEVRYLPPYSPDLNPIEMLWSKVKSILRSIGARTTQALHQAIGTALSAVTQSDLQGWFHHAGYPLH